MLEHRKGQIIDRITHERTGKTAEIRLDKRSLWFWCRIGEDYHESKNGDEVKEWARRIIALSDDVTWVPVLEMTASHDEYRHSRRREEADECEVKLSVDRYYVGRTPTGKWYRLSWESCDEDSARHVDPADRVKIAQKWDRGQNHEDPDAYENREKKARGHTPGPFKLPHVHGSTTYLPYDETAYQGAATILAQLRTTAKALESLLASKKATATLQAVAGGGSFLLTSGAKKATTRVVDRR